MSVLVKGMKMPESCHECVAGYGGFCFVASAESDGICPDHGRPDDCPLIELPAEHGRLIDALEINEVKWVHTDTAWQRGWNSAIDAILESAQTIIEAEVDG